MITLAQMRQALGGKISGNSLRCSGPGHSSVDDSLSVTVDNTANDGFRVHSFAGDDWRVCRDDVRRRLGLPMWQAQKETVWLASPGRPKNGLSKNPINSDRPTLTEAGIDKNLARWREAVDPRGTIVEKYLSTRALNLPNEIAGEAIRFHGSCPWGLEEGGFNRVPAMLAPYRDFYTDAIVGLHRTRLTAAGEKVGRKMAGTVRNAAMKLDANEHVTFGLFIAEGIETALAARQIGFKPIWALGSASAIAAFPLIPTIESIGICAEFDDNGANARAIDQCGMRWFGAGREVNIIEPRQGGDLNDAIRIVLQ